MLDPRLLLAAELVREGAVLADVGTDHAHLPLHLLSLGRLRHAFATDVARGPLSRAEENVRKAGREGEVTLLLTDGLAGMESCGLTDIAVCGMGGELIAAILAAAPFTRDPTLRLVLQPMTHADSLRRYLAASGFCVFAERYALSGGKPYVCIGAVYDGKLRSLDERTALLGTPSLRSPSDRDAFSSYLSAAEKRVRAMRTGRQHSGDGTGELDELLSAIQEERIRL